MANLGYMQIVRHCNQYCRFCSNPSSGWILDLETAQRQIDDFVRTLRKTRPAPGTTGPLIPGDPEREAEAIRRREGIPLVPAVVEELRDISRQSGIRFE